MIFNSFGVFDYLKDDHATCDCHAHSDVYISGKITRRVYYIDDFYIVF